MKKKILIGVIGVVVLAVAAVASASFAFQFGRNTARFDDMKATQTEITAAVASGDYEIWYGLMTENGRSPEILETITKDNFAQYSEAYKLMDQAKTILTDLGVKAPFWGGKFEGGFFKSGHGGKERCMGKGKSMMPPPQAPVATAPASE